MAVRRTARKTPKSKIKPKSKPAVSSSFKGGRGPSRKAKHSKVAKLIRLAKARAKSKVAGKKRRK
ncbi:hypothetical protein HY994_00860 [Candidatus Micrarchaeota archaeon]|nr:hypothetical protein [Candidatus Micrarchaeota archaeon]